MWRSASRRASVSAASRRLGGASTSIHARIPTATVPGVFCSARGRYSASLASARRLLPPALLPNGVATLERARRAFSSAAPPAESVESIYQKKTPLEHVLLRPGMYIGSVEPLRETMWVPSLGASDVSMQQRAVEFVPALYKIFDEIIVNAVDNKVRDPSMRHLDVVVEPKGRDGRPWISVHNDGRGIPVEFHRHEKVYVPELVLGHLLTGSNFDDASARLTGGRHGYGAKLTNIFSAEFVVETGDAAAGLRYKQTWRDNMRDRGEPEISMLESHDPSGDFTRVSFSPDLKRFEMDRLTPGMLQVLTKRVVDVAGCLSDVEVTLNGKRVPINGFESYVQTFRGATTVREEADALEGADADADAALADYIYARVNKRWQVGVLPSDIGFVQVSFVNGMSARRGGTHVNYIADQLCRRVADHVNKKFPDLSGITGAHVKPHLALFINCQIENPTFDSQMKELLTSRPASFGSTCILSDRFSKMVIASSGVVERVVDSARAKQRAALLKKVSASGSASGSTRGRLSVNVPKLEDANWAGGPRSSECALILTEGDSAKALAVAGLAVVGRDKFGVFPLRGKVLNVRDATVAQLSKNAELAHLCTILGLNMDETYDSREKRKQLRYGKVVVMTDQDHDGSHIKGLLFNLFHTFWPELLQASDDGEPFMSAFITPLVKVTSRTAATASSAAGGSKKATTRSFYSLSEYLDWKREVPADEMKQCSVKYYKGLGTSTSAEGREYFRALEQHLVPFTWAGDADGDALDLAFSKARAGDRKAWLLSRSDGLEDEAALTGADGPVSYQDFVNKELIHFSHADNLRSLPSVVDGLKVSQRKVLFACLKRKLSKEVKVAQLAGYCSEHTAYHHGEASLHATIVNMAQDYVGSNNLPLLCPSGQFGTRLQGGKDAASARYIFTSLQRHTRALFPEDDDALLEYVDDDGFPVEPRHYVPILPMLLVNGSEGIGTGWSSSVPSHHPVEIIDNLLRLIAADDAGADVDAVALSPMAPWVKGFHGHIRQTGDQSFVSRGVVSVVNSSSVRVTELPVGRWVEDYKRFLWELVGKKAIRSFSEHHSERDVRFDISMARADLAKLLDEEDGGEEALIKLFKLETSLSTSNMHAFDAQGTLRRYETSGEVLRAFYSVRRELYAKRKAHLEKKQAREVLKLRNRIRFIDAVAHGELQQVLKERIPKAKLVELLEAHGFSPASAFKEESETTEDKEDATESEAMEELTAESNAEPKAELKAEPSSDFDYLLNTPLLSFTREVVDRLQREHDGKEERLAKLRQMTPAQVWRLELEALRASLLRDKDFRPVGDA